MQSRIEFHGGAGFVTGANFVLHTSNKRIMLDCGLAQGFYKANEINTEPFPYNPAEIDALFISHAHMDHIGRVPKLIKDGFEGPIYSTKATLDLAPIMFEDALKVMRQEEIKTGIKPFYSEADVEKALSVWKGKDYDDKATIGDLTITFKNAGHILGSAMIFVDKAGKRLVYTGDLGNSPEPFLPDRDKIEKANYLMIESVYGDRDHENKSEREKRLFEILKDAQEKNKTVLIPVFSLERAQIIILAINNMIENSELHPMRVYLDSPLASAITEVFRQNKHLFNQGLQEQIESGDKIFEFPYFSEVQSAKESNEIFKGKGGKVILAGSGMSTGGKVLLHEKELLENPNNVIVFVGYQGAGTLGRKIQEGVKKIRIDDKTVKVRAKVETISGFSAHADKEELLQAVSESQDTLQEVFVVLGESKSSLFFAQRVYDYLGLKSRVPQNGDVINIDF